MILAILAAKRRPLYSCERAIKDHVTMRLMRSDFCLTLETLIELPGPAFFVNICRPVLLWEHTRPSPRSGEAK